MYNLRYHIASLVAVFLALALGLVLGGLVVQRGAVSRQQTALVEGLQDEFASLRDSNEALKAENEILRAFADDMSVAWAEDRLVGKNVIVLASTGRNDGVTAATEAIESAGGNPIVITVNGGDLSLRDSNTRSAVASGSEFSAELLASVATSLAAEWSQPTRQRPTTQALVEAGALSVDGLDPGMAAYALIDVAADGGDPDEAGLVIAQVFAARKGFAAAAESVSVKTGVAHAGAARGLAAFDTLGTAVGRYTLVALATGAKPGYYGLGETAIGPYPDLPEK